MIPPARTRVAVDSGRACELIICLLLFLSALWVFMTLLPTLMLNSEKRDVPLGTRDYIGWTLWGLGFATEAIADQQKWFFKSDPNNAVSGWPFFCFAASQCLISFLYVYIHPSWSLELGGGGLISQLSSGEKAEEHTGKADRLHSHPVHHCENSKQGSVAFDMTAEACVLLLQRVSLLRA